MGQLSFGKKMQWLVCVFQFFKTYMGWVKKTQTNFEIFEGSHGSLSLSLSPQGGVCCTHPGGSCSRGQTSATSAPSTADAQPGSVCLQPLGAGMLLPPRCLPWLPPFSCLVPTPGHSWLNHSAGFVFTLSFNAQTPVQLYEFFSPTFTLDSRK